MHAIAVLYSDTCGRWFNGTAASGVGGPHVGINSIWPMAIIMQALTSTNDGEIADCLQTLKDSTAGSGAFVPIQPSLMVSDRFLRARNDSFTAIHLRATFVPYLRRLYARKFQQR